MKTISDNLKRRKLHLRQQIEQTVSNFYEDMHNIYKKEKFYFMPVIRSHSIKIEAFDGHYAYLDSNKSPEHISELSDDELIDIIISFETKAFLK